jgi:hypothetical protein
MVTFYLGTTIIPGTYFFLWLKTNLYRLYSQLSTYNLQTKKPIGIVSYITTDSIIKQNEFPAVVKDAIQGASLEMIFPDGHEVDITMYDDGLHSDFVRITRLV